MNKSSKRQKNKSRKKSVLKLSLIGLFVVAALVVSFYVFRPTGGSLEILECYFISYQGEIASKTGTAFAISTEGHFVTTAHALIHKEEGFVLQECVMDGRKSTILFQPTRSQYANAIGLDVALLKIDEKTEPFTVKESVVETGSEVVIRGFFNKRQKVINGTVAGFGSSGKIDIYSVEGDFDDRLFGISGSPLLFEGAVIGVVNLQSDGGYLTAIPWGYVEEILRQTFNEVIESH